MAPPQGEVWGSEAITRQLRGRHLLANMVAWEASSDFVLCHSLYDCDLDSSSLNEEHLISDLPLHDHVLVWQGDDGHQLRYHFDQAREG